MYVDCRNLFILGIKLPLDELVFKQKLTLVSVVCRKLAKVIKLFIMNAALIVFPKNI